MLSKWDIFRFLTHLKFNFEITYSTIVFLLFISYRNMSPLFSLSHQYYLVIEVMPGVRIFCLIRRIYQRHLWSRLMPDGVNNQQTTHVGLTHLLDGKSLKHKKLGNIVHVFHKCQRFHSGSAHHRHSLLLYLFSNKNVSLMFRSIENVSQ